MLGTRWQSLGGNNGTVHGSCFQTYLHVSVVGRKSLVPRAKSQKTDTGFINQSAKCPLA